MNIVEAIGQVQGVRQLSDGKLARLLGIDKSTISYIKSGKRQPGTKVLRALARQLPELQPYILAYISNGDKS